MGDFIDALAALGGAVGSANVITDRSALIPYETATFALSNRVHAVVLPDCAEQVQQIVQIANRFELMLYPVSRGRNWGLGSRVPVTDGNVIVDLQRMNRIVDFSEDLSYVTVEPGVTFRQLADYLANKRSRLYAAVIGGPPDASLIGNALERGDGLGPLGERSEQCCALEAVTGTGARINTGPSVYGAEAAAHVWTAGAGPNLQGLLFQSNFAIVTRMTIWLTRRPEHFQGILFTVPDDDALTRVTSAMRALQQDGVLKPNSYALWNPYKMLASLTQYPWPEDGQPHPASEALLAHLPRVLRGARWIGMGGLYSVSWAHALAERQLLRKAIGKHVSRLMILDRGSIPWMRSARRWLSHVHGLDPELLIRVLYTHTPFLGIPTEFSVASTYWRKRSPRPPTLDPDRDRCGLHWVCTAVPFDGHCLKEHASIIEELARRHELEPNISYLNASQRMLKCFAVIAFDRAAKGEELRARAYHDELLVRLQRAGFPPTRLGVQSMGAVIPSDRSHLELLRKLKGLFDPNNVIAPGHYDFRDAWQEGPSQSGPVAGIAS